MNNMLDAMIDDYANAMRRVALPERMRAGVMDAVHRERERLTSCTTSPRPAHMAAPAQTRAAAHAACAVQQLDGRVLTITATSPAGQTFTQRYRIIPVEGFEEAFQANLEATLDAVDAGADPAEASNEPLFILEQLG